MPDDRDIQSSDPGGMSDADREAIVESLASEMGDLFHDYVAGQVPFEELTFEMFDTLQTLHAVATGNFSIEWVAAPDIEDLANEPMREDGVGKDQQGRGKGKPGEH